ncbi:MAG TPA: NUDIX domain-containing protein [Bacteroidia bacterium]|jgi:ADP-ribose pyrophosphatase YjhB (NUDIX family)|nr:NUDIX domain-containing protein [Bacteroidia bacterium]
MIKIFFPEKIIYLIKDKRRFTEKKNAVLQVIDSSTDMRKAYDELIGKKSVKEIYFYHENEEQLFAYFSKLFKVIDAAGGLVKNKVDEWLFIFRHNKWDLPKGKLEKNEAIADAAVREVEEECGIGGLSIIKQLPATYHIYFIDGKAVLKRTYWFEMMCKDESPLVPQLEEGITAVKWFSKDELKVVSNNTFESVRDVMSWIP